MGADVGLIDPTFATAPTPTYTPYPYSFPTQEMNGAHGTNIQCTCHTGIEPIRCADCVFTPDPAEFPVYAPYVHEDAQAIVGEGNNNTSFMMNGVEPANATPPRLPQEMTTSARFSPIVKRKASRSLEGSEEKKRRRNTRKPLQVNTIVSQAKPIDATISRTVDEGNEMAANQDQHIPRPMNSLLSFRRDITLGLLNEEVSYQLKRRFKNATESGERSAFWAKIPCECFIDVALQETNHF